MLAPVQRSGAKFPSLSSPHLACDISCLPRWQVEFSYDNKGGIYKTARYKQQWAVASVTRQQK
jgi:hypothetical protein